MFVIFERVAGGSVAINAFQVYKIVPSVRGSCLICSLAGMPETVKGDLESVTKKFNGFIPNA